jgi:hypothetical protein
MADTQAQIAYTVTVPANVQRQFAHPQDVLRWLRAVGLWREETEASRVRIEPVSQALVLECVIQCPLPAQHRPGGEQERYP